MKKTNKKKKQVKCDKCHKKIDLTSETAYLSDDKKQTLCKECNKTSQKKKSDITITMKALWVIGGLIIIGTLFSSTPSWISLLVGIILIGVGLGKYFSQGYKESKEMKK